ncbi:hypothetical protein ONZ45_g5468 [Pleurotus djamor]|nr:hypothetical protein ONZ45_g5468 [Pleurotus djamor]
MRRSWPRERSYQALARYIPEGNRPTQVHSNLELVFEVRRPWKRLALRRFITRDDHDKSDSSGDSDGGDDSDSSDSDRDSKHRKESLSSTSKPSIPAKASTLPVPNPPGPAPQLQPPPTPNNPPIPLPTLTTIPAPVQDQSPTPGTVGAPTPPTAAAVSQERLSSSTDASSPSSGIPTPEPTPSVPLAQSVSDGSEATTDTLSAIGDTFGSTSETAVASTAGSTSVALPSGIPPDENISSRPPSSNSPSRGLSVPIQILIAIAGTLLGVACIFACFYFWRRRRKQKRHEVSWKWFDYWNRRHKSMSTIITDVDVENQALGSSSEKTLHGKDDDAHSLHSSTSSEPPRVRVVSMGFITSNTNQTKTTSNTNLVVALPPSIHDPSNTARVGLRGYEPPPERPPKLLKRHPSEDILTEAGRRNAELLFASKYSNI